MAQMSSLRELYFARLREFYRQPARIFWVYGFPTVVAVVLGLAFQSRPIKTVKVDLIASPAGQALQERLEKVDPATASPIRPIVQLNPLSRDEALRRLKAGKTPLVVEAETSTRAEGIPRVTYHYDESRPDAVAARVAVDDALQRSEQRADKFVPSEALVTEKGSRYIDRLIPGLIGVNTMGGGLWGVGFFLVNFRIAKLLKRIAATPMPRRNFLLAILGSRLTFLLPDVAVMLALGVFAFGMPVRGNLLLLALIEVVGGLAFAGIGLLVACRASTIESVSGLMNLVMIPMWLLSGVFFPADQFQGPFGWVVQALPLTQLVNALRLILLEGVGIAGVATPLLILSAWAVVTFSLALRFFKWS